MDSDAVLDFLDLLKGERSRTEETAYDITREIFTCGGCYRLYKILRFVFANAQAYKVDYGRDGVGEFILSHVVTRIGDRFYDINGEFVLPESGYTRMEPMDAADHAVAEQFCYSFTQRGAIPC